MSTSYDKLTMTECLELAAILRQADPRLIDIVLRWDKMTRMQKLCSLVLVRWLRLKCWRRPNGLDIQTQRPTKPPVIIPPPPGSWRSDG